ncbi:hypothetical protein SCLCIDRAFT_1210820 [Scleroderma citrinum Foug A]|uniref:Uncharacterized protein n=1 Tax=Scleroderma citrinum Foug A TaxID=1036808 RepID=A0A0C2ZZD8_9AGAM|nr:hypothetical protein SCLCIDRAFT_1210820 [Scleroderma citrinum Foug A]
MRNTHPDSVRKYVPCGRQGTVAIPFFPQWTGANHISAAQGIVVVNVETGPNPSSERLNTDTVGGPLRARSGSRPGSRGHLNSLDIACALPQRF